MCSAAVDYLAKKIQDTELIEEPYPYIYIKDALPQDFYNQLVANQPQKEHLATLTSMGRVIVVSGDPNNNPEDNRIVLPVNEKTIDPLPAEIREPWMQAATELITPELRDVFLNKFSTFVERRLGTRFNTKFESLYVRDYTGYELGPHTDSKSKVITVLFYLAPDNTRPDLGTSMYAPKREGMTCPGGPHYMYKDFNRTATMPYLPNSMFAFFKNDKSWHGVEPVEPGIERNLLLFDVYVPELK
jgi:hypothetical protein